MDIHSSEFITEDSRRSSIPQCDKHTYRQKNSLVDYSGLVMPIHNPRTGEIDTAQIFVAVLGASGYTFVHATHSQKQEDFIYSHVMCYNFFGGSTKSSSSRQSKKCHHL